MATRLTSSTFGYQNFYSATLTADITSGTTVIGVSTVPTPTAGILVFEPDSTTNREVVLYTSKGASTITAPSDGRGYSGSTAASHLQGSAVIMAPVDKWFTALASGELSSDPLRTELFFDYVASGLLWTGDAYASTKNASMTSGVLYILGKRLTLAAVTARVFTASKDTYVDVTDNGDGTGLITYNEVSNNAASPALATNAVRIAIIVTGATNIAAAGSVNQGQDTMVLPIASSIAYSVTDSIGNLIFPTDPLRKILGYRQIIADFTTTGGPTDVTGLNLNCIIPAGRKVKVSGFIGGASGSVANNGGSMQLFDVTAAAQIASAANVNNASADIFSNYVQRPSYCPALAGGIRNFKAQITKGTNAETLHTNSGATNPSWIMVELE